MMVILGAGASFDSTPRFKPGTERDAFVPRPPLADELFGTRFRETWTKFPGIEPLVPRLHTAVEATLQRFQEESQYDPERHKQLMAIRHYVARIVGTCEHQWFAKHRITNHAGLLDGIRSWCLRNNERVCFVTFNYDTFIEQALADSPLHQRMEKLEDYIKDETYKVIKLHGSVTWFHKVVSPDMGVARERGEDDVVRELIDKAKEVTWERQFVINKRGTVGKIVDSGAVVIPAIAIPVQEKPGGSFDECPSEHVEALRACIPSAKTLMLIGWAGKEKKFLKMLEALPTDALGVVVGKNEDDAKEIIKGLPGNPGSYQPSTAKGFTGFVEDGLDGEFLAR